jgi:hypothetical protein
MPLPTFQLLLDFSKNSVWPFENWTDHKDVVRMVSELRLQMHEQLDTDRIKELMQYYFTHYRPRRHIDEAMLSQFADLLIETRIAFGDTLTKAALAALNRDGFAPKRPRDLRL